MAVTANGDGASTQSRRLPQYIATLAGIIGIAIEIFLFFFS